MHMQTVPVQQLVNARPGVPLTQLPLSSSIPPAAIIDQSRMPAFQLASSASLLTGQTAAGLLAASVPVAGTAQPPLLGTVTGGNASQSISTGAIPSVHPLQQNPQLSALPGSFIRSPLPVGAIPTSHCLRPGETPPIAAGAVDGGHRTPVMSASLIDQTSGSGSSMSLDSVYWQACSSHSKTTSEDDDWGPSLSADEWLASGSPRHPVVRTAAESSSDLSK